jgi:hypothetical protein
VRTSGRPTQLFGTDERLATRRRPITSPVEDRPSPWATTEEGATYVRCPNRDAFRKWAKRAGIIPAYRGRVPLFAWADIDRALGLSGDTTAARRARRAGLMAGGNIA